ncbi:MAG: hypothetical protein BJ554DRAFT_548 [Olpidium bornovanus]|uniref:Uncharacterized protein n=1 Tax=Olpidium bornovanus TaxID=278681 RepID=A0A8H7ZT98_9FUNG|nr:MAG: hypothetical protein BJ554DRAFT_548 [Olpidium bornovanus]
MTTGDGYMSRFSPGIARESGPGSGRAGGSGEGAALDWPRAEGSPIWRRILPREGRLLIFPAGTGVGGSGKDSGEEKVLAKLDVASPTEPADLYGSGDLAFQATRRHDTTHGWPVECIGSGAGVFRAELGAKQRSRESSCAFRLLTRGGAAAESELIRLRAAPLAGIGRPDVREAGGRVADRIVAAPIGPLVLKRAQGGFCRFHFRAKKTPVNHQE